MRKILALTLGATVLMMGYVEGVGPGKQLAKADVASLDNRREGHQNKIRKIDGVSTPLQGTTTTGRDGTPPSAMDVHRLHGSTPDEEEATQQPVVEPEEDAMPEEEWRTYGRGVLVLLEALLPEENFSQKEQKELNVVIATWLKQLEENGALATAAADLRSTVYGGDGFSTDKLNRVEVLFSTVEICLHYTAYCEKDVQNKLNTYAARLLAAAREADVLNEDRVQPSALKSEGAQAAMLRRVIERINGD